MRRLAVLLLIVAGCVVALAAAGLAYLASADLAPLARHYAPLLAGRPMEMGSLRLVLGRTLRLRAQELRFPDARDLAAPDVARAAQADATLEWLPLLHGRLVVRALSIERLVATLSRDKDGVGNWASARPAAPSPDPAPSTLPPLLDLMLRDSDVVWTGSSGRPFRVHFSNATLRADSPASPAILDADGMLGPLPARLQGSFGSFNALQDRPKPFPMKLTLLSGRSTLTFDGTATDPVGFDGLDGAAALTVPVLGDLLHSMGVTLRAALPVAVAGKLVAQGGDWLLSDAKGALDQAAFTGELHYAEGSQGAPDGLAAQMDFGSLDLVHIAGLLGGGGAAELPDAPSEADPVLDIWLTARQAVLPRLRVSDLAAHLVQEPGRLALEQAGFGHGGGRVLLSAAAVPAPGGTRLTGMAAIDGMEVRDAARVAGTAPVPVTGKVSGRVELDITGRALLAALARGRVVGALGMWGGSVARKVVRQASVDVGALLGDDSGYTRLYCLLAVADMHNGIGPVGPVRLMSADGTIDGAGQLDLRRQWIDLTIQSRSGTTGALALDIPIGITGPLGGPAVAPRARGVRTQAAALPAGLPAEVLRFVRSNACLRG